MSNDKFHEQMTPKMPNAKPKFSLPYMTFDFENAEFFSFHSENASWHCGFFQPSVYVAV